MVRGDAEGDSRRQRIYAACESCRKKKSKCVGGQPCKSCLSTARASVSSNVSKKPSNEDPEVIARATEICIIDFNRKQRGPKAKVDKKLGAGAEREDSGEYKGLKRRRIIVDDQDHQPEPASSSIPMAVHNRIDSENKHDDPLKQNDAQPQSRDPCRQVYQDGQSSAASYSPSETQAPSLTSVSSIAPTSSAEDVGTGQIQTGQYQICSQDPQQFFSPSSHARQTLQSLKASKASSNFHDEGFTPGAQARSQHNPHLARLPPLWAHNPSSSSSQSNRQGTEDSQISTPSNNQVDQGGSTRRSSVSTELLSKLSQFYTAQDRPLIALALSQFTEFDASTKLIPSRYLFGEEVNPAALFETPSHLQLALLSLLAHRSLLLPSSQSSRDLKSVWVEETPAKLTRDSPLSGEMRESMINFGRRSWNLSHDILLSRLAEGVVEPSLLQTGYILDMSASEDGIGTKTMAEFKEWLFHIVKAWNLHLMDSDPSFPINLASSPSGPFTSPTPSTSPIVRHLHVPPQSSPEARKYDARQMVSDPIDREALRRVVFVICSSYCWTHSNDHNQPASFNLGRTHFQVNPPEFDDEIHLNSRWKTERTWKETKLLSLVQRSQKLWNRANLLLHTPLEDLLFNRGPEPDLQSAIQELEDEVDEVNSLITIPKIGQDPPIKFQAYLESRLAKLILNRLFSTIGLYSDLRLTLPITFASKGSLRISEHLVPQGQKSLSIFETLSGVHPNEGEARRLVQDGETSCHHCQDPPPGQPSFSLDSVRPSFSKNPRIEALQSVIEIGWLVTAGYEKIEASQPGHLEKNDYSTPLGEVGTAVGSTLSSESRALRWPRHLKTFAQHAFAMSSEVRVAGWSWIGLSTAASVRNNNQPPSLLPSIQNFRNENQIPNFDIYQSSAELWEIGEKLVRLLRALGKTGSAHSAQTALLVEKYRDERKSWIESQLSLV